MIQDKNSYPDWMRHTQTQPFYVLPLYQAWSITLRLPTKPLTVSKNVKIPQNLQAKHTKGASAISSSIPRKNATEDANVFGWCLLSGSYGCYSLDLPLPLLYPGHSKRGAEHRGSQRWPKLSIDHDLYC